MCQPRALKPRAGTIWRWHLLWAAAVISAGAAAVIFFSPSTCLRTAQEDDHWKLSSPVVRERRRLRDKVVTTARGLWGRVRRRGRPPAIGTAATPTHNGKHRRGWRFWRRRRRHLDTPEHEALLTTLRAQVDAFSGLRGRADAVDHPLDDSTLRRFLEVAYWRLDVDGQPLVNYVSDTVAWRETFATAAVAAGTVPGSDVRAAAASGKLYVAGRDRLGRPLVYYRPGRERAATQHAEASLKLLVYTVERATAMMPPEESDLDDDSGSNGGSGGNSGGGGNGSGGGAYSAGGTFAVIVDCRGFGLAHAPPLSLVRQALELLMRHYPMRLGYVRMVRPGGVAFIWRIISPALAERTKKKMDFVPDGDTARALLELVEPDQLDAELGGASSFVYSNEAYFGPDE